MVSSSVTGYMECGAVVYCCRELCEAEFTLPHVSPTTGVGTYVVV